MAAIVDTARLLARAETSEIDGGAGVAARSASALRQRIASALVLAPARCHPQPRLLGRAVGEPPDRVAARRAGKRVQVVRVLLAGQAEQERPGQPRPVGQGEGVGVGEDGEHVGPPGEHDGRAEGQDGAVPAQRPEAGEAGAVEQPLPVDDERLGRRPVHGTTPQGAARAARRH
jgi:hypothetical protein